MLDIEQEKLCDHCCDMLDQGENWKSRCEGSRCDQAHESYVEEHGLVERDTTQVAFIDLRIGSPIWRIRHHDIAVPRLEMFEVSLMSRASDGKLSINLTSKTINTNFYSSNDNDSSVVYNNMSHHCNKRDAVDAMEKYCLQRIVECSRLIGEHTNE